MTTWDNRLRFEVSSADPDSLTPVWVDLTTRVRDKIQPIAFSNGRQNDLEQSEPGRLEALLDNRDGALTYGNTASPYPWWGPGRKCRLRETIAGVTSTLFTGYLQVPTEQLVTAGVEQWVSISAVDRAGRLASSEPFSSALGAYILSTSDLKAYWPLTDAAPPYRGIGPVTSQVLLDSFVVGGMQGATDSAQARQGLAPPGGESAGLRLLTGRDEFGNVTSHRQLSWPLSFEPPVGTNDSITVVMWAAITATPYPNSQVIAQFIVLGTGGTFGVILSRDGTTGNLTLVASGAMTGTIALGVVGSTGLLPIGIRYTMAPANMELWLGGRRLSATPTGTPPTAAKLFQGNFALPIDMDVSHMQVYVGTTYSRADFDQQIIQGYTPLERQSTGERIRTVLRYAGVPSADLTQIDSGVSLMQSAKLAGKDPLTAVRDAVRTEQGLFYTDGSGLPVFRDRNSLYSI